MEPVTIFVLVLTALAFGSLVWAERNSRRKQNSTDSTHKAE